MAWLFLLIASTFEIVWAVGMKYTENFTRLIPSIITLAGMVLSVYFLNKAMKVLPIGTAYAVWTGLGAVGTVIMGIVLFNEPKDFLRLFYLALILVGIIGLKASSGH